MAWTYTADQMIESIKTRIRVPEAQSTYTAAKILNLINEELERQVLPRVLACRENYFMAESDIPLVSGTDEYKIPYRAIGGKVKAVKYVDAQGNESPIPQIAYEEAGGYTNGNTGDIPVFYLKRNSIKTLPSTATGTLRVGYYMKPSAVVAASDCGLITAINTSTNVVTVGSRPTSWSASESLDLVRGKGGFECLSIDQACSLAGTNITFPSSLPSDLEVGDYVCLATESPFPQIPADIHSYLTLRVCKTMLEGLGFMEEAAVIQKDIKEAEAVFDTMLTPRSDGNPKKIKNQHSALRRGYWR